MSRQEEELIASLNRSIEQIINIFKLIKVVPPDLKAKNIIQYAKLIEGLLTQMNHMIPKMCVPKSLFLKMEKQSLEIGQIAENYMREHRKCLVEIKVLEDRLKEAEERQAVLIEEKNQLAKNSQHYRKKAKLLKKSGQQSLKNLLELGEKKQGRPHRHSLPNLQRKQKLSLLYLMGPSNHNERLVHHLMSKR